MFGVHEQLFHINNTLLEIAQLETYVEFESRLITISQQWRSIDLSQDNPAGSPDSICADVCDTIESTASDAAQAQLVKLSVSRFKRVPIVGDGNCLFRCIAEAVFADQEQHDTVRTQVALSGEEYLRSHPGLFGSIQSELEIDTIDDYLSSMQTPGTYATHLEILMAGKLFNANIHVLRYKDHQTCRDGKKRKSNTYYQSRLVTETQPGTTGSPQDIYLLYREYGTQNHDGQPNHYDLLTLV